jgi:predicted MPP superfamily phosphohydrolase
MKTYHLVLFLSIVFTIYFLGNSYIFLKGYYVIPRDQRILYTIIFLSLAVTFIVAKILEQEHSSVFSDVLNVIGGFWIGFMFYASMFLFISDIAALILRIPGIISNHNIMDFRKWAFLATLAFSVVMIAGGFINAVIPVIKEYNITIAKPSDEIKNLRIAAVSDIHLGSVIRKRSMKKLSAMLEDMRPDIVLLLGDLVDGELGPVLRGDLLKYFTGPDTKDGLYAITGNHEFIGGAKRTIPYIESKGIRVLKDEIVTLPGGIQLVGRLDRDSFRYFGKERLSLEELMKDIDHSRPIILLDHQPLKLGESEKNGIDLQLSGHTHNGQMWPLNYITGSIFELSYGYMKRSNTQYIVSSGFGLWGPRIRSGSRSEVLLINIEFSGNGQYSE